MNSYKVYSVSEAQARMERYCAYQERCHKEVANKLYEMRMIPEVVEKITLHLMEHNFLNETRFAQAFARGKFRIKKWGRNRIKAELKKREISVYNINLALKEFSEEEYLNALHELATKRASQITGKDLFKKRKKLADYLLYRGWESHLVYEKVNSLI